ncbi:2-oxoglutarate dehydrogenase, E2 component, dihydrolipoamide succinyltransferase [Oryzobacter telluris]|uniref:2-oxoglutarate dehydrogenase, E2 component, dihydrolipoamide succinyltransferase n=1 Tax=Oryzobacter telluris TaxID=3149179 RepID=UPI00370DDFB1
MSERVQMPALGESVTEGTVTRWLKNVGDAVEVDEPLLEVSTDKVDTEIPSPVAGTLEEILVQEDDTVPVGADLAVIGDGSGGGSSDGGSQSADEGASTDEGPADEVSDPSDGDAVAEAGDEGGQEPAEPQASDDSSGSDDSGSAEDSGSEDSGSADSGAGEEAPAASSDSGSGGGSGTTVTMPALGESVTEGTVTRWLKAEGDEVAVDEPLLEVSTDKVDTEIPSPVAGTLTQILVQEDETVPVGADLAIVGGGGGGSAAAEQAPAQEKAPEPEAPKAEEKAPDPEPEAPKAEEKAPEPEPEAPKAEEKAPEPEPAKAEAPAAPAPAAEQSDDAAASTDGDRDAAAYVTPLVRKLAADHGIDLASLAGTGIGGRIRKQDVIAAAEAKKAPEPEAAPAAPAPQATAAAAPAAPSADSKRGTTEKMSRLRKTIARRMVESLQVSAQLTTVVEVDVTRISRLRDRAKADFAQREGTKLSFLPFFALAAVEALKAHPTVNASIEDDEVTYYGAEHLGVAVDTEKGLLVPVLKNAGDLNIAGLARGIADVADRTRNNKIMPDDLAGGTFTITNTGSRGALFDTPIINQPQVAILGTGSVVKRPIVVITEDGGETIAIRSMVYLALSYDHRIVDGADAARFLTTMKQRLEEGAFEADLGL